MSHTKALTDSQPPNSKAGLSLDSGQSSCLSLLSTTIPGVQFQTQLLSIWAFIRCLLSRITGMLSRCLISSQNVSARKTLVCAAINCAVNKRAERLSQSSFPRRVIGSVTIVGPAPVLPLPCLQAQPFLNSLRHVHTTSVDKAVSGYREEEI